MTSPVPTQGSLTRLLDRLLGTPPVELKESLVVGLERYFQFCPCLDSLDILEVFNAMFYAATELRTISCTSIHQVIEFKMLEGRYPNPEEHRNLTDNAARMARDPLEYSEQPEREKPVKNLQFLSSEKLEEIRACSICQGDIEKVSDAVLLPGCPHVFHASSDDCLGGGASILTWLGTHDTCPECRREVIIPNPTLKRRREASEENNPGISG